MSDLSCPRCQIPLAHLHSADACARCGGVFLGSAVSTTVARALDPRSQQLAQEAAVEARAIARTKNACACPVCRLPMRRYRFGPHLEVDSCHHHGSWYDKGELERLKAALEQGGVAEEVPADREQSLGPPGGDGSGLELEERVRNRPPTAPLAAGGIDPSVQEKINALAQWEGEQAERERARRRRRRYRGGLLGNIGYGEPGYDALDAVFDVIRFLR